MMNTLVKTLLITCSFFATVIAQADTLLIDVLRQEPANDSSGLPRPDNGMTRDQVRTRFGDAVRIIPPVGNPPISRWVYPKFTVYFEYDRVISSVVNRASPKP